MAPMIHSSGLAGLMRTETSYQPCPFANELMPCELGGAPGVIVQLAPPSTDLYISGI